MSVIVLGAGPAGLGALVGGRPDMLCFERGEALGGIAGCWNVAGHQFDFGGHFLHPNDEVFVSRASQALARHGHHLVRQKRKAWIYFDGVYLPYPFQYHVGWLSRKRRASCAESLREEWTGEIASLQDEMVGRFGNEVFRIFIGPYMRKSWGVDPSTVASSFAADRIEGSHRKGLLAMWQDREVHPPARNEYVYYPSSGSFGDIFSGLAEPVHDRIRFNAAVKHIDLDAKTVTLKDGTRRPFERLISTLPLDQVMQWTENSQAARVRKEAARPSFLSAPLMLVALAYDAIGPSDRQRIYFHQDQFIFHKLCLHHNDAPSLRAKGSSLMLAEINPARAAQFGDAVKAVDAGIRQLDVIPASAALIASDVRSLARAYPLIRVGERQIYEDWIASLADRQIDATGRWGAWRYVNSDEAFMGSFQLMRRLFNRNRAAT